MCILYDLRKETAGIPNFTKKKFKFQWRFKLYQQTIISIFSSKKIGLQYLQWFVLNINVFQPLFNDNGMCQMLHMC